MPEFRLTNRAFTNKAYPVDMTETEANLTVTQYEAMLIEEALTHLIEKRLFGAQAEKAARALRRRVLQSTPLLSR